MSSYDSDLLECVCGKRFHQENALSNHRRACLVYKGNVKQALSQVPNWRGRKRTFAEAQAISSLGQDSTLVPATTKRRVEQGVEDGVSSNTTAQLPVDGPVSSSSASGPSESLPTQSSSSITQPPQAETVPDDGPVVDPPGAVRSRYGRLVNQPRKFEDFLPSGLSAPRKKRQKETTSKATGPIVPNQELLQASEPAEPSTSSTPPTITAGSSPSQPTSTQPAPPIRTDPNNFGLFCQYDRQPDPSHAPNQETTVDDLSDIQPDQPTDHPLSPQVNVPSFPWKRSSFWPYPNQSSFLLGEWFWTGNSSKSQAEFQKLLSILLHPSFELQDIEATPWDRIHQQLGDVSGSGWVDEFQDAGWITEKVSISVPFHNSMASPGPKPFEAGMFPRRSIVSVMKERLGSPDCRHFHFEPYELWWKPSNASAEMRVYGELYTSPVFLEAHRELQNSPPEPGCSLPRVVVGLMFQSDETHLTQFGDTKLWPLYLYFGNDSKYSRSKPSLALCNHIAYFMKLPENFKDFVSDASGGKPPTAALTAHCQRELLHAQLELILDDEFILAYEHGIVITCYDQVSRRFYPRFFTHSADYKEKVSLTGIYNLGKYPCPRCLIPLVHVYRMGMKQDRKFRRTRARVDNAIYRGKMSTARNIIYNHNRAVNNKNVKATLGEMSLAPSQNAFSNKLSRFGFNFFQTMVVDLMHEVESGNWRALFIHILRILTSVDDALVLEMDRRYRQVPTFGQDTIRKFRRNCSEMKNLAARDWEDMLQCAIPALDGLLSGVGNKLLLDILYVYAYWHGLAKMRLHTEETLELLDNATQLLGAQMRSFAKKTSALYVTKELKKEQAARLRRNQAANKKKQATTTTVAATCSNTSIEPLEGSGLKASALGTAAQPAALTPETSAPRAAQPAAPTPEPSAPRTAQPTASAPESESARPETSAAGARYKSLNLETYKFHALGDYVETIRRFGTTDSYSTETGELEHRNPKSRYSRTSRKNFLQQLTQIDRRQARVRRIRQKLNSAKTSSNAQPTPLPDPMDATLPTVKYVVGRGQNDPINLLYFMRTHEGDPSIKGFMSKLRTHLQYRVCQLLGLSDDNPEHLPSIFFQGDRIYRHQTIRFNYTTYDVRRAQDVVNPARSQCNAMLLADERDEDEHPFLYCKVLGIFHANLHYAPFGAEIGPKTIRLEFLWVRWYRHQEPTTPFRLDTLTFPGVEMEDAFGFVDPRNVLRACHIIPAFAKGKTPSEEQTLSELAGTTQDWAEYYVNRFVDRDMLMRYHWGMGVGHTYSHPSNESTPPADSQSSRYKQMLASVESDDDENAEEPEPAEPSEPAGPSEPAEPSEPAGPFEPAGPSEPTGPSEPAGPAGAENLSEQADGREVQEAGVELGDQLEDDFEERQDDDLGSDSDDEEGSGSESDN